MAEAINKIRQGEADALEDLYLLTYKDSYSDIRSFLDQESRIWNMVKEVYVQVWNKRQNMPEANIIRLWIRVIIIDLAKNEGIEISGEFPGRDLTEDIRRDEKAAATLIEIEEELRIFDEADRKLLSLKKSERDKKEALEQSFFSQEEAEEEEGRIPAYLTPNFFRLIPALFITGIAVGLIFYVMEVINHNASLKNFAVGFISKPSEALLLQSQESESLNQFGWIETEKGRRYKKESGRFMVEEWLEEEEKLYYFDDTGYMAVGMKGIGGQKFKFDQSGALIQISREYKAEDNLEMIAQKFKDAGNADLEKNIVDNSIKYFGGWMYFLLKLPESDELPKLMRFREESKEIEIIAERVEGFILVKDHIWYSADQKIELFAPEKEARRIKSMYKIGIKDEKYGFYDIYGNLFEEGESLCIDNRVYSLKKGMIERIGEVFCPWGSDMLKWEKEDKNIYLEHGSVFLTEDAQITALCSSGSILYYSVNADEGEEAFCEIYKYDAERLDKKERIGRLPGAVRRMYYYGNKGEVYMEYAPKGKASSYTRIAVITEDGNLMLIEEEGESEKEDEVLELLMVEEEKLYCYRKKGKWNQEKSEFSTSSVSRAELDNTKRVGLEGSD
ncbi:MAG: hypothetical protein Q4A19_00010 [Johnsonella sp.]|nr:hypothetical protein [Johnsonella sp.]